MPPDSTDQLPHASHYVTDDASKTIRPALPEGDDYFGLGPGTNGTAAITRRALVEPSGYVWVRADGSPAIGVLLIPGSGKFTNPWSGE